MKHRCNVKKIFGKAFHKNMSATDLQAVWYAIPDEIKGQHKDIENLISAAVMAENAAKDVIPLYEGAKKALKAQEEGTFTAAAATAGNAAYAVAKAAEAAAKAKIEGLVNDFKEAGASLYSTLEIKFKEMGVCVETEDKDIEKQNVL